MSLQGKFDYRRDLPHIQKDNRALFVTFNTHHCLILPESARTQVLGSCVYEDGKMIDLEIAVVMPDHVHLIFWQRRNGSGLSYSIPEIMQSIKGASAHRVNELLERKGQLWQTESFDHVIRTDENLQAKIEYVRLNPVRRGIVSRPEDYRWIWERSLPVL